MVMELYIVSAEIQVAPICNERGLLEQLCFNCLGGEDQLRDSERAGIPIFTALPCCVRMHVTV